MKRKKTKWINFRDKLPKNGAFTEQRETPETPEYEYSHGAFYYSEYQACIDYRKTAQWRTNDKI